MCIYILIPIALFEINFAIRIIFAENRPIAANA